MMGWIRAPLLVHLCVRSTHSPPCLIAAEATRCFATEGGSAASSPNRTVRILYAGHPDRFEEYRPPLLRALDGAGLTSVDLSDDPGDDPGSYEYMLFAPNGPVSEFAPFSGVRAVLSLWAGVEWVSSNPTVPPSVPVTRMVDPGLRDGMVEYVTGHVLRYHLRVDDMWRAKEEARWGQGDSGETMLPLASQRTVGVLGMGELGGACADSLSNMGFRVLGWSRTEKSREGAECRWGPDGLDSILAESDVLVLLLPNTPETADLINVDALNKCKPGVAIINPGRGSLIDDGALLSALDSGRVSGATLDVFRTEPLPPSHPYWRHPRVLVTPHIAAKTRAATAALVIAENIRRAEAGRDLLFRVDREAGY